MAADIRRDVPPAVAFLSSPWAVLAAAAVVVASAALAAAAARSGDLAAARSVVAVPVVAGKANSISNVWFCPRRLFDKYAEQPLIFIIPNYY